MDQRHHEPVPIGSALLLLDDALRSILRAELHHALPVRGSTAFEISANHVFLGSRVSVCRCVFGQPVEEESVRVRAMSYLADDRGSHFAVPCSKEMRAKSA